MRTVLAIGAMALAGMLGIGTAAAEMPYVPPFVDSDGPTENSFVAGTQVLTDSGFKSIEDIVEGDLVVSYDLDRQQVVTSRVRDVTSRVERATYEMGIGGITIRVTRDHPLLTDQGWRRVIETAIGSTIIGYDGATYPHRHLPRRAR